ncbi:MAG: hypothetical protein EXR71_12250 [Myxococcales bacterium]|nr:hypothetical protein [Myxococcales bacterium]
MNSLKDALKGALAPAASETTLVARESGAPLGVSALPRPEDGEWERLLSAAGVRIDRGAPVASWVQRTAGAVRALEAGGRKHDARALIQARDEFVRRREKRAWEAVKGRFEELGLPEKTYRALKQEGADVEKVLARLSTRRAEEWRGMAGARLRDILLERP